MAENIKDVPILHQKVDSACDGSIVMLPKKTEKTKNLKIREKNDHLRQRGVDFESDASNSIERSTQCKVFSRKNIQQVQSRLKNMRSSNYLSNNHLLNMEEASSK